MAIGQFDISRNEMKTSLRHLRLMNNPCHRCGEICCRCWRTGLLFFGLLILVAKVAAQPALPKAAAVPPVPTHYRLQWDSDEVKFRVYEGNYRLDWQTNYVITNKSLPLVKGRHYGIAAIAGDAESSVALWPSNMVFKTVVQTNTAVVGQFKDAFVLGTNITVEPPQLYLRIRQELSHYE